MLEATQAEQQAFDVQNGYAPEKLIVSFYEEAVYDKEASEGWMEERWDPKTGEKSMVKHPGAGRKLYKRADFVEIRIPGNKDEIRRRPVRPSDKMRFAKQWEAYEKGLAEVIDGLPIEHLPFLTKAQVMEFRSAGIRTAENLRDMSDADAQKFMGINTVRKQVADFLSNLAGHAPIARMESELAQRDQEIANLKAQMADLIDRSKKGK